MSKNVGLDLGTNTIISASSSDGEAPTFKIQRDAFFSITPKTLINRNSIKASLDKRGSDYILTEDNTFLIVGQDALDIAVERNSVANRPMSRGVISPKEKNSLPMLKLIIEKLIGSGSIGDKCVYSIPAVPVDTNIDVTYHKEIMGLYLKNMGFDVEAINEAYAV